MANFIYNEAKRGLANKEIDLDTDTIKVALLMTNTTADTDRDADTLSAFVTLDECNGASYARQTLNGKALAEVAGASGYVKLTASDSVFATLGAGTRSVQGILVYKHVTNDADSVPIAFIDTVGSGPVLPFNGNGGNITIDWSGDGVIQI